MRRRPQSEIDALITHVKKWSPVANTFTRPVNLEVSAVAPTEARNGACDDRMGSLALSRGRQTSDHRAPSIADEVARDRAAEKLAPLAPRSTTATLYPGELLRAFGERRRVGQPHAAERRCRPARAIQSIAALGEVCGATAFMAWCQNTLVWYVVEFAAIRRLQRSFGDGVSSGQTARRHRALEPDEDFFGIEKFKLKGRKVDGGYVVQGRAALGVESRPRPLLRHHLRARG